MTWVRLDDQFFRHPKVLRAGRDARDLYLAALCYAGGALTDGRIPTEALPGLGAEALGSVDSSDAVNRLVGTGLWEAVPEGYLIHDYLRYNPSRQQVLSTREIRAQVGRMGGIAKSQAKSKQIATIPSKSPSKIVARPRPRPPSPTPSPNPYPPP